LPRLPINIILFMVQDPFDVIITASALLYRRD
jgi:hypothetical protein